MEKLTNENMKYESVDTVIEDEDAVHYPIEFLYTLNSPGIPSLNLKIDTPIMLLHN